MNRRAFMLATLFAALPVHGRTERFARGLLWRVAKDGVPASHVYGTIHVADARLAELPGAVRQSFDAAKSLMLEFVPDAYSRERFLEASIGLSREVVNKLKPWGDSLAQRDELTELAERTLEAYLERDLGAIWRLREQFAARHPQIAPHQAVMTKRVVHDRSVVMAFRMQRQLRRGEAFVALGALHLYGEKGVLSLLEADGYRADRVF